MKDLVIPAIFSVSLLKRLILKSNLNKNENSNDNCKKCDISNIYLLSNNKFKCKVTTRVESVRGSLSGTALTLFRLSLLNIVWISSLVQYSEGSINNLQSWHQDYGR